jgi:transcriptional regulator with XRE-family HTH domain
MSKPSLGKNIREFRKNKGMSQSELAKKVGVSQKVISAYERDYRVPPSSIIPCVAENLGTTPNALYGGIAPSGESDGLRRPRLWEIVEKLQNLPEKEFEEITRIIENYLQTRTAAGQSDHPLMR